MLYYYYLTVVVGAVQLISWSLKTIAYKVVVWPVIILVHTTNHGRSGTVQQSMDFTRCCTIMRTHTRRRYLVHFDSKKRLVPFRAL